MGKLVCIVLFALVAYSMQTTMSKPAGWERVMGYFWTGITLYWAVYLMIRWEIGHE